MKEMLEDIREKLRNGFYQNEEHVRLSLVARVVQALGWDIWNPKEVNTEFVAVPTEDRTKVDMALFADAFAPSVFIEIKGVGGIKDLPAIERQLRDYNRNITAPFTIITDGAKWRFYSSQAAGEFSGKCFKALDLLSDDPADVETAFTAFVSKTAILNGTAEEQAKAFLKLTQKQKIMEECLPRARRMVQEPPFPSLPEALAKLVAERGFSIVAEEARVFIARSPKPSPMLPPSELPDNPTKPAVLPAQVETLDSNRKWDLRHTEVIEATFGSVAADNWNTLVQAAVKIAIERGMTIDELRGLITGQLREGRVAQHGFFPVEGTGVSRQYTPADTAWANACALAKRLGMAVRIRFRWREKKEAAFPGKEAFLQFP